MLTPTGFRQVEALARRFREIPVDACFASDLTRTSLTARAVYVPQKLPLYRDPAFREIRLGRWEDLPFGYLERFESEAITCFRKDPVSWHIEGGGAVCRVHRAVYPGHASRCGPIPGEDHRHFLPQRRSAGSAHGAVFSPGCQPGSLL